MVQRRLFKNLFLLLPYLLLMQSCYLFCLFKADPEIEESVAEFVEKTFITDEEKPKKEQKKGEIYE